MDHFVAKFVSMLSTKYVHCKFSVFYYFFIKFIQNSLSLDLTYFLKFIIIKHSLVDQLTSYQL